MSEGNNRTVWYTWYMWFKELKSLKTVRILPVLQQFSQFSPIHSRNLKTVWHMPSTQFWMNVLEVNECGKNLCCISETDKKKIIVNPV